MRTVYFTICSNNYFAYARTLFQSLARSGVDGDLHCFLADDFTDRPRVEGFGFTVTAVNDCDIPTLWDMAFRYNVVEFNTAIKPFCVSYLFRKGYTRVIYVDPDLYFVRAPSELTELLDAGENLVLTPHICEPLEDGRDPDDLRIMQTGIYNLGFGAWQLSNDVENLIRWWERRLAADCVIDLPRGIFVDQKYMDLGPAFVSRSTILRHPGYNAAYWNLAHRKIRKVDKEWHANDDRLCFFHFSGVVPNNRSVFSKHQNRFVASDLGPLRELLDEYLDALAKNDHELYARIPYAYDKLPNGASITPEMRQVYREFPERPEAPRAEIFSRDLDRFIAPARGVTHERSAPISRIMLQVWRARPDLQSAFPLSSIQSRLDYLSWWVDTAKREHGVPEQLIAPAHDVLKRDTQVSKLARAPIRSRLRRLAGSGLASARFLATGISRTEITKPYRHLPIEWRVAIRRLAGMPVPAEFSRVGANEPKRRDHVISSHALDRNLKRGVGVFGYFQLQNGVGAAGRRTLAAIEATGFETGSYTIPTGRSFLDGRAPGKLGGRSPFLVNVFHANADNTVHLPQIIDPRNFERTYRVGFWAWELSNFPVEWLAAFDNVDEVWVPSEFVRHAVQQRTTKPVVIIPHPVPDRGRPTVDRDALGLPDSRTIILSALDLDSYAARKNPLASVSAFVRAFPSARADSPILVVKVHGGASMSDRDALLRDVSTHQNVMLIDRTLTDDEMWSLHCYSDIFISLHRSEGFGLNIAEAMLTGSATVATNYSGNIDFLDSELGHPVGFSMVPVKQGEYPFGSGQWWAEPDVSDATRGLKVLVEQPELRKRLGAAARARILKRYSTEAVATLMRDRLQWILEEVVPSRMAHTAHPNMAQ